LKVLSARERHIFEARRLAEDPPSLEQLGHELSISSERVRQIEISAFAKVRRAATGYLQKDRSSLDRVQLALAE
jgi:RNA polymerase sigma-32 factor